MYNQGGLPNRLPRGFDRIAGPLARWTPRPFRDFWSGQGGRRHLEPGPHGGNGRRPPPFSGLGWEGGGCGHWPSARDAPSPLGPEWSRGVSDLRGAGIACACAVFPSPPRGGSGAGAFGSSFRRGGLNVSFISFQKGGGLQAGALLEGRPPFSLATYILMVGLTRSARRVAFACAGSRACTRPASRAFRTCSANSCQTCSGKA